MGGGAGNVDGDWEGALLGVFVGDRFDVVGAGSTAEERGERG